MTIDDNMQSFAGRPVVEWSSDQRLERPGHHAYRIGLTYDEADEGGQWRDRLAVFLEDPDASQVEALVVGAWGSVAEGAAVAETVEALVVARDRLPNLKALFIGDISSEECEISWLQQGDMSPIFSAYPDLEHFGVRGGMGLSLGTLRLAKLRSLVIESGGLSSEIVREVASADLPQLEHLELWLGAEGYGASYTMEDLEPIISGSKFPALRVLALRDSEMADAIAAAVAKSPVLERVEELDLSMGTLGDEGAAALIASPAAAKLKSLNLSHHYMSTAVMNKIKALGPKVDVSDQEEEDDWGGTKHRYVAVGE